MHHTLSQFSYFEIYSQHMQLLIVAALSKSTHSVTVYTQKLPHLIVLSLRQQREQRRREKKNRHTVSLSYFTLFQTQWLDSCWSAFTPLATTLPSYSSVANLSSLLFVAWMVFLWGQMSVNTVFSDSQVKGCLVRALGLKVDVQL